MWTVIVVLHSQYDTTINGVRSYGKQCFGKLSHQFLSIDLTEKCLYTCLFKCHTSLHSFLAWKVCLPFIYSLSHILPSPPFSRFATHLFVNEFHPIQWHLPHTFIPTHCGTVVTHIKSLTPCTYIYYNYFDSIKELESVILFIYFIIFNIFVKNLVGKSDAFM